MVRKNKVNVEISSQSLARRGNIFYPNRCQGVSADPAKMPFCGFADALLKKVNINKIGVSYV
jgi:hypothetical protein